MGNAVACHYAAPCEPCHQSKPCKDDAPIQLHDVHTLATTERGSFKEFDEENGSVEWHPGRRVVPCLLTAQPKAKKFEAEPSFDPVLDVPLDMPSETLQPSLRLAEQEKFELERSLLITKVANTSQSSMQKKAKPDSDSVSPGSLLYGFSELGVQCRSMRTSLAGDARYPLCEPSLRLQFQFEVCDRTGVQLWTCTLANSSDCLVVTGVHSKSPFALTSSGGSGLVIGDVILEIDGITGNIAEMRQRFSKVVQTGFLFDLVVQPRPSSFRVCLERTGAVWDKLGLVVGTDRQNRMPGCMRVLFVKEDGLLAEWNKLHAPLKVCSGDWLTHVNDISGNNKAGMQAALKPSDSEDVLWLTIATPPRDDRLPVRACAAAKAVQSAPIAQPTISRGRRDNERTRPPSPESFPQPVQAEKLLSPDSRKRRRRRSEMSVESH